MRRPTSGIGTFETYRTVRNCPFIEADRKSWVDGRTDAIDPQQTCTVAALGRATAPTPKAAPRVRELKPGPRNDEYSRPDIGPQNLNV
jgi:hypothetical protein